MAVEEWSFIPIVTLFAVTSFQIFQWIYLSSHLPYMDEEFHIPQAAKFCEGKFSEWDPKITTLPGLYLLSIGLLKPIALLANFEDTCGVWNLRLINLFVGIANLILFQKLLLLIHRREKGFSYLHALLSAINMATFPLLYFFTFLYYTDQLSTLMVFAMIYFHLKKRRGISTFFAFMSVLTRQTNIVWVGCLAVLEIWASYKIIMRNVLKKNDLQSISVDEDIQLLCAPFASFIQFPTKANLRRILGYFVGVVLESLPRIFGYSFVITAFCVFVIINKGIVVGDRSAHQPVFHVPQLFYFALLSCFFGFPFLVTPRKLRNFASAFRAHPLIMLSSLGLILFCVQQFTYVHQYLISDNRHYPFYIWKRLIAKEWWTKYLLAPIYLYGLWAIKDEVGQKQFFLTAVFFTAIFASLVPQKLLEFRYFIIPFLIFSANVRRSSYAKLITEFLLYQTVNMLTIYLFVKRPFIAADQRVAHFMW